ncbi:hypothetical protein L1049_010041 [Liquidambar formosana]|uniref:Piwi domain-containing protein n=1 Tax=Liquidambar formosana TaxID=63359 RepID=A0AAP0N6X9_LIQFO
MEGYERGSYRGGRGGGRSGGRGGRGRGRGRGRGGGYQQRQPDQHRSWVEAVSHPSVGPTRIEPGEGSKSSRGGYGRGGGGGGAWRGSGGSGVQPTYVQSQKSPSEPVHDPVIPDMQSLSISEQLPPSSGPESRDRTVPIRRPDKGGTSAIARATVLVNHFPVKFNPESIIGHYVVDIKPEPEVPSQHGRPQKITKATLLMIMNKLSSQYPVKFPMPMIVYDGEKNIFSAVSLPTGKFMVEFSEGEDMKTHSYMITVKLVHDLNLCRLEDYYSGNLLSLPRDVLQAMDLVTKENLARHMISIGGRGFHSAKFYPQDDLGRGIAAYRVFQHSLKPTSQGLALCLDYSVLPFWKQMPVIDFLKEHVRVFDVNNFRSLTEEVENALIGLKVTVTHRVTTQKYTIAGLTDQDTQDLSFIAEDPEGMAPPRKRYPKEHLDQNAARKLKHKSLAPSKSRDGPCGGDVTENFGMEVGTNMTIVECRRLRPPKLKLRDCRGKIIEFTVDKEKCQWNLVRNSLVDGKEIVRWAVIDFSSSERYNKLNPDHFIPKLISRCRTLGIHMEEPLWYESASMDMFSSVSKLREIVETVDESCGGHLQILVCVMARKDAGCKYLKWVTETRIGIITQCCLSNHANEAKNQYLANLALKINAKLGGSNVELIDWLPTCFVVEDDVMFVGADVNHPAPGNTRSPSIAAVVATVNWPAANRYLARIRPQVHRTEKILNFGEMCAELIEVYARLNGGVKPKKIVVFRDGVSEGQFDMVRNEELIDLKRAIQSGNYSPTITLIVAQKQHRTRLFLENDEEGGSIENVPPD